MIAINPPALRTACMLPAAVIGLLFAAAPPAAWGQVDRASLAHNVPADVGLFIELHNGADVLKSLVEPELWLTLAELVGQPGEIRETTAWRTRVHGTVRMTPEEAIDALFAQRVAFVSETIRNTRHAVILCQPTRPERDLLSLWEAQRLPTAGRNPLYRLPNNVALGLTGGLFLLGDARGGSLFDRVLDGASPATGPPQFLADDADFKRLYARVPEKPDGVVFLRLRPAPTPTTAPQVRTLSAVPELPRLVRDSANVLFAMHREGRVMRMTAVGDGPVPENAARGALTNLLGVLPEQTLIGWAGHVDYAALPRMVHGLPPLNVFRVAVQMQERAGNISRLAAALRSETAIAIGAVTPSTRTRSAPPIPAVAVLLSGADAEVAFAEWSRLVHVTVSLYRLTALKRASPPVLPDIEVVQLGSTTGELLDLSALLGAVPRTTAMAELHLAWTRDGDVLVIASHVDWLRAVIAARNGGANLGGVLSLARHAPDADHDTALVVQSGPLADLGTLWIEHFRRTMPHVLQERWWRDFQPGGGQVRLGLEVVEEPGERRLRVVSVQPGAPADGFVKAGDYLVGCNNRRFYTEEPLREIQTGLVQRPHSRWFDVLVERNRMVDQQRIPLTFVDPVHALRRVIAVGNLLQRVVYVDEVTTDGGARGHLALELRDGASPLFAFPLHPPPTDADLTPE